MAALRSFVDGRTYDAAGATIRLPDDPPLVPGSQDGLAVPAQVSGDRRDRPALTTQRVSIHVFLGWFTTSENGQVTIVFGTFEGSGDFVPDPSAPNPVTGHLTQWFGGSFNNRNFVVHDTINFTGTGAAGHPISLHAVDHVNTNAAGLPHVFDIASC